MLFRLGGGEAPGPAGAPVTPVAATPELGSQVLSLALVVGSMAEVLQALAGDVVLVPVWPGLHGQLETRLFGTTGGDGPPGDHQPGDLCLFSSAASMERFLGENSGAYFIIQHGAAVMDFLIRHCGEVGDVVFDPAGPNSLRVACRTFTGLLNLPAAVDGAPPAQLAGLSEALGAMIPDSRVPVKGFDLRLDSQWGRIDCADPVRREEHVKAMVAAQTRSLGDRGAGLRRDMRTWLSRAAERAASADATRMYFLFAHTRDAAAALSLVSYFHDFGDAGGKSHLDQVADHLLGKADSDEEVFRIDVGGEVLLRHSWVGRGNEGLGASAVPLLNIDYWLEAPDRRHVVHVCFSSPHVTVREAITKLADNVVFNGTWVTDSEPVVVPDEEL